MGTTEILDAIITWEVLKITLLGLALGGVGGLVHAWNAAALWTDGERSADTERSSVPQQMALGAIAAVAILYLAQPTTALGFIGGSLAAGFAGQAVLNALSARAVAVATTKQLRAATHDLNAASANLRDLNVASANLRDLNAASPNQRETNDNQQKK